MFGWFQPTCPCDPAAKAWVEERLLWLSNEFEAHAFNEEKPVILPTAEFFPDPFEADACSAKRIFGRVCEYMGVSENLVHLKLMEDAKELGLVDDHGRAFATGAAGLYEEGSEKFIVRIARGQLHSPMDLVGTMAHELSHVLLLGESRISPDVHDNELLTDLNVVFQGLGIFLANSPRNWPADFGTWPGTKLKKPEYMTPPMFGYALAHLAWFRNHDRAKWMPALHYSARANLKQGLRYLEKTEDSSFKPWHARMA